ncbi:hypothetical protein R5H30_10800 [Sulfitobacter sp. D35]|uniref:hypothetical protein n=1 Tax=Sulfitobacter sp. D35 TaxID=3083252 RepID=UPI00296FAB59|nr:hypothetical protein [Sulfitobacter sp. D35]MDW4498470.1 hypothetical protein [Sulfitobacter sp. D35]
MIAPRADANALLRQLSRSGLTQQDVDMMVRAGATLYADGRASAGDDTIWSNPATGSFGLVEVASVSGECVSLTYKFRTARRSAVQSVAGRRCLSGNRWVSTP